MEEQAQQGQGGGTNYKQIGASLVEEGPQAVLQLMEGIASALPDNVSLTDLAAQAEGDGEQQQQAAPPEAAMPAGGDEAMAEAAMAAQGGEDPRKGRISLR